MADVDDVLTRLRGEAPLTCRLGFTLDRARAREKMREFQLADPRRWVLLLVRAAIMRGASGVAIAIDSAGMTISFDGAPLEAADFEELYASMFATAEDPLARSRRELALACNAAMALSRGLRIESGDGASGRALELEAGREDVITALARPRRGTSVRQDDRPRVAVLDRLLGIEAVRPERELLRAGCQFAAARVLLDGVAISGGIAALEAWGTVELEPPWSGRCGYAPSGAPNELVVLQHGVVLTRRTLEGLPQGLVAVVEGAALRTDVSRNEPVQDEQWHALLTAVRRGSDRALRAVACGPTAAQLPAWLAAVMRARLAAHGLIDRALEDADLRAVAELPLWRCLDGRSISTLALAELERVAYVAGLPAEAPVPATHADVLLVSRGEVPRLCAVQPRAIECSAELLRAQERERERLAARTRPHPVALADDGWVLRHEVEHAGVRVVLGLPLRPTATASLRWVSGGYLLCEVTPALPLPLVAIVGAALTPNARSDAPVIDPALARAVDVLGLAIDDFIARLAQQLLDDEVCRRDHLTRLRVPLVAHLHAWGTGALDSLLRGALGLDAATAAALEGGSARKRPPRLEDGAAHPLFALPLLDTRERHGSTTDAGERLSLAQLAADRECRIVPDDARLEDLAARAVVADATTWALLGHLLGAARLDAGARDDAARLARERFLARPQIWSARRPRLALGPVDVEHAGVRCSLGVRAGVEDPREPARIVVLRERRQLAELRWPSPIAGIDAVIAAEDLAPNADWSGLADDAARARVIAAVVEALARLLGEALARDDASEPHRRVLTAAACAVARGDRPTDRIVAGLTAACERHAGALLARPLFRGHALGRLLALPPDEVPRESWGWWDRALLRGVLDGRALEARPPLHAVAPVVAAPPIPEAPRAEVPAPSSAAPHERAAEPARATPRPEPQAPAVELRVPSDPPPPDAAETDDVAPIPEPAPIAPASDAPAPDVSPIERVIRDVLAVLRAIRSVDATWAGDPRLDRLEIHPLDEFVLAKVGGDHVVLNRIHPVAVAALAADPTPRLCAHLLASAVFTAINTWSEAIADADERTFLAAHAEVARRG